MPRGSAAYSLDTNAEVSLQDEQVSSLTRQGDGPYRCNGRQSPCLRCLFLRGKMPTVIMQRIGAPSLIMLPSRYFTHASVPPAILYVSNSNTFPIPYVSNSNQATTQRSQTNVNTGLSSALCRAVNTGLSSALCRAVPHSPYPAPDSPVVSVTLGTNVAKTAIGVGAASLIPCVADTSAATSTRAALPKG